MAALDDSDLLFQAHVMKALYDYGDRRAVPSLITIMRVRHDSSVATILGNFGDRRAVGPLLEDLETLRQPVVPQPFGWTMSYYYYAIRALGKLGDPRAIPLLEWIRDHEREPLLKGKSLADMAEKALQRIAEQNNAD
jgi:HEAT repeat protein